MRWGCELSACGDARLQVVAGEWRYGQWKEKYQKEATPGQLAEFEQTKPLHSEISGHR